MAVTSAFVFSAAAFGGSYTASVIPPPSGFIASMVGINNSGQVTGIAYNSYNATIGQAFIGSPSGSTVIPLPAGWGQAYGNGNNNVGQITGTGFLPTGNRAFIGTVAGVTAIPLPAGWSSTFGNAINDSGQVVGTVTNNGSVFQAFIGSLSGSTVIPLPAGWPVSASNAINNSGQVAGYVNSGVMVGGLLGLSNQAFIATVSGITALLPPPLGWSISAGTAINDSGQVAGNLFSVGDEPPSQVFIGSASGSTAIPLPAGATYAGTTSACLNNSGVVVGYSDAGGWAWSASSGTQLLNTMVPSGWSISNAISISQNGLILAYGSFNGGTSQYVELIPTTPTTPAPGAGFLAVVGLLLVLAWRYRLRSLA